MLHFGWADVAAKKPIRDDSIVRLFSMTKPITCAAAMMCYERGCFQMEEPVEIYRD
eukprot:gene2168-16917_t